MDPSLAVIGGLALLGYALASDKETFKMAPRDLDEYTDEINGLPKKATTSKHTEEGKGHSNQVPFFGANLSQSMYSGSTSQILDSHTGAGSEYFQKRETKSFYDIKPGTGNPFGQQSETEFEQSRMVTGMQMKNVFPVERTLVGAAGSNDGFTNIGKGGFQQEQLREWQLPLTTDEIRVASKPKLSYLQDPVPGVNAITQPGIQAPVNKNKPDKFALLGMERANTSVGAQVAQALQAEQPMKTQTRETTSTEYFGSGGGQEGLWSSYVRAFTEPFEEFMKLTTEGRPNPAGPQGAGNHIGADMYSAQTKKDESVLSDATRFNAPLSAFTADAQHLGSFKYNEPLKQDVHTDRNHPSTIDALKQNPYALPLDAY